MWQILLLYAVFSLTYPLGKYAMGITQPIFFVGCRMLFAGTVLLLFEYFRHPRGIVIERRDRTAFMLLGFFGIYASYCLQYWALPYISATKWALLYTASPFVTAFFSYLQFGEQMTFKKIVGLILGVMGLIPALLYGTYSVTAVGDCPVYVYPYLPEIAVLAAVVAYSYGWVIARQLIKRKQYSSVLINGASMLLGGACSLITSALFECWTPTPVTHWSLFAVIVVSISAFNIFSYLLGTHLLRIYTATFLTFMSFVDPLYVALLSWFFLGEVITWHFFVAVGIFLTGLYLFYQEELVAE